MSTGRTPCRGLSSTLLRLRRRINAMASRVSAASQRPPEVDRELRSSGKASDLARAEALAIYSKAAAPKPWFLMED